MEKFPQKLQTLIQYLKKLPGVGAKTAERFAFHFLNWEDNDLEGFSKTLFELKKNIQKCEECGALKETLCPFCSDSLRDQNTLCIVASPRDIFLLEETKSFKGIYHLLPCLLSPIDGKSAEDLNLDHLKRRIQTFGVKEVIIALDSTLEGDTTSLYLNKFVDNLCVKTSRLAFGLPVGSPLEYIDEGTLARALIGRQKL